MNRSLALLCPLALAGLAACTTPPTGAPAAGSVACQPVTEQEIAGLFERWNHSLQSGDPRQVAANYAPGSILLPTVSNRPRLTPEQQVDYFQHFLENRPSGSIDMRRIQVGCNSAVDAGLYSFRFAQTGQVVRARYTFTYRWDGRQWLISSHHSSAMPEKN